MEVHKEIEHEKRVVWPPLQEESHVLENRDNKIKQVKSSVILGAQSLRTTLKSVLISKESRSKAVLD